MAISESVQQLILTAYASKAGLYQDFCRNLCGLVQTLLSNQGIQIHSVVHRIKSTESLSEKINRTDKGYTCLEEITDIAGIRITTYFADDVDEVAKILKTEFFLDPNASTDKRVYSDPDRFGYSSLHYVLSFGSSRNQLAEYAKFTDLKCEVQIRSILQHAWAEIEHDLGYKSAAGIPAELRRKFARIASLLELADDEFGAIRDALVRYEQAVPERIRLSPEAVNLDLPSFRALYSLPSSLVSLDNTVAEAMQAKINHKIPRPSSLIDRLHSFGIQTVDALEKIAFAERSTVGNFVRYWLRSEKCETVDSGIGVFYLLYVLAWKTRDRGRVLKYLNEHAIGLRKERDEIADRILAFCP